MRSRFEGTCPRCSEPIRRGDDVVKRHGDWIHTGCHPGADDE